MGAKNSAWMPGQGICMCFQAQLTVLILLALVEDCFYVIGRVQFGQHLR